MSADNTGKYRESRCLEASIIDWLQVKIEEGFWTGFRFEKSFSRVYDGTLPVLCVNVGPQTITRREIGGKYYLKAPEVSVRFFARNDGERLDVKDYIIECLEEDIDYYTYSIEGNDKPQKILSGKISIRSIIRDDKELVNIENLNKIDKYRHIIIFSCHVALT